MRSSMPRADRLRRLPVARKRKRGPGRPSLGEAARSCVVRIRLTESERAAASFTPEGAPSRLRWTYPLPTQMLTAAEVSSR